MSRSKDQRPAPVPEEAKQAGEAHTRWKWAEPSVWTERMLTALEQGVKGGIWRWPNAFFAVHGLFSLAAAYAAACQSAKR